MVMFGSAGKECVKSRVYQRWEQDLEASVIYFLEERS